MYKLISRNLLAPTAESGRAAEGRSGFAEPEPRGGKWEETPAGPQLYCELCKAFISDQLLHVQKPRHQRLEEAFLLHYQQVLRASKRKARRPSREFGVGRHLRRLRRFSKLYSLKL